MEYVRQEHGFLRIRDQDARREGVLGHPQTLNAMGRPAYRGKPPAQALIPVGQAPRCPRGKRTRREKNAYPLTMHALIAVLAVGALSSCRAGSPRASSSGDRPVNAAFIDLPRTIEAARCERVLVALVRGGGKDLTSGDVVMLSNGAKRDIDGPGVAVVARIRVENCDAPESTVAHGRGVPPVTFAGGEMTAHLDVLTPDVYIGRLEGTAAMAEHQHETSWEILAAVEASGTFVRDGKSAELRSRQIVFVPPGTRHAWRPAAGSKLVAVQLYYPPGPEQRFLKLAAAEAP